ncbi:hypothetical protein BC629DRAFT_445160 [Irpex lacteus]|nr:hypothetical protein BC629DRAFT_445160 [Irpex lacteus]
MNARSLCILDSVSCGGRVYQHSIRRGSQCPTLSYYWCPVSSAYVFRFLRRDLCLDFVWLTFICRVRAGLSQKHCVNLEMDTFVAGVSRAGAQPQHQPRRQEQTPTLRVVTRDLHVRSDPIEMTTYVRCIARSRTAAYQSSIRRYPLSCSEADSASSISASQKMLSTQAMIHSGPSSSTTIFPPDAASFSSRIAKAPSWAGSRDMQDRGGAG